MESRVTDDERNQNHAASAARPSGPGPRLAGPDSMARLGRRVLAGSSACVAIHQMELTRAAAEGARRGSGWEARR
jgi:hypothetical protein